MQLSIVSWNGSTDINNNSDFTAWFEQGALQMVERDATYVERANTWQKLASVNMSERDLILKIRCLGTIHSQRETIKKYFSPEDFTSRTLVVEDTADTNRQWYVTGRTTRVNEEKPGIMAVSIALDEPFWRTVSESTGTLTITASGQSTDFTVIGNMKAKPILSITPTSAKAGDYAYQRWIPLFNNTTNTFTNYPLDVGGIDTAALIAGGKMQSGGADLRVRVDGVEVDRWMAESTDTRKINTTDTAIWINVDLPPKEEASLVDAIGSTDTVSTLTLSAKDTGANGFIRALEASTNKIFMIDDEAFTCTGVSRLLLRIDGITRAAKGTTAAAHSANAVIRHVPYDVWLVYGSSDATAPVIDDTRKPMISPDSTNTNWIWYSFYDSTSPTRSAQWTQNIIRLGVGGNSGLYTATQNTNGNPASVLGMRIQSYLYGGITRAETSEVAWDFNHPAGITTVEAAGNKYRYSSTFPATAALQYYNPSVRTFVNADNQASPSSDQTWTAFTIESTDTGALGAAYNQIRFSLAGSVGAVASNYAGYEIDTLTVTMNSTDVPNSTPNAEQSAYRLNATITNSTTGEYIALDYNMATNRTLTVDCNDHTVTYDDGSNARSALRLSSVRTEWLDMNVGANTITYTETGVAGVTLGVNWENRNTL